MPKAKDAPDVSALDCSELRLLDAPPGDEDRLTRGSAHACTQKRPRPRVTGTCRKEVTEPGILVETGAMNPPGGTLPRGYGSLGRDCVSFGLVWRENERTNSGHHSMRSVPSGKVLCPVDAYGTEQRHRKHLPRRVSREWAGRFGLTEAAAGSDPACIRTPATRTYVGYDPMVTKTWIYNAPFADVFVAGAKPVAYDGKSRGFALDKGAKGMTAPRAAGEAWLRASTTGEIAIKDVEVVEDALLPDVEGPKGPFGCVILALHGIARGLMRALEACWDAARQYGLERNQLVRPLAQAQRFQKELADMQTIISAGLRAAQGVEHLMEEARAAPAPTSLIERSNYGEPLDVARFARSKHGPNNTSEECQIICQMVKLETVNACEGTRDVHALTQGRSQTGLLAVR